MKLPFNTEQNENQSCFKHMQTVVLLSLNRKPSIDENADPSDSLMNMLKKIYTEGDDEMKRTINKAWSESQEKKFRGEGMMDFWTAITAVSPAELSETRSWNDLNIKCYELNESPVCKSYFQNYLDILCTAHK